MDIESHRLVSRQTIDPPHRHLVVAVPFEEVCDILSRHGVMDISTTLYRGITSVILSGEYNETRFLQPADMFPAYEEKPERSFEDYFSSAGETEPEEDTRSATEFVFSGYTRRPDLSQETRRDYVSECDACVRKILVILDEEA